MESRIDLNEVQAAGEIHKKRETCKRIQNPVVGMFGFRLRLEMEFISDSDFWIPVKPRVFASGSGDKENRSAGLDFRFPIRLAWF